MSVKAWSQRLLLVLGLWAVPLLAPAAAAYPFPQNRAQPYTSYYPAYSNADVQSVYTSLLADQVTTAGAGGYRRVRRHGDPTLQADSTVSEGIGYGMIIAVYMNDQALFDDLWRYYNLHLDGNGLMNWYISADGATVLGSGGASDADQDAAWALCMAIYQWGTSSYGASYTTMAQSLISKLYNVYVDPTTKAFSPWGGAGNNFNVSYFDPAMYRVFGQVSGNSGWLDVVDGCYNVLFASLKAANANQNNGLVPAWNNSAGDPVPGFSGAPIHFQYDSCRTPFRIGKDWYFFGEPRAKQYLDKINSFYVPIGAAHITDGYDLNGNTRPQYDTGGTGATGQSAAFVAPAMMGAMDVPGQSAFVQEAYDRLKTNTLLIGGPYYDQCWTVMGMLWASGNYLNYVPTPTPTPTPDVCQFRVKVNTGGAAQSGYSADKAYAVGGWGYVPAYAGGLGTSGGPVTGDSNAGLYLSERYDSSGSPGGEVRYSFTVPNGPATVTLHWAETYFTSAGQRRMNVFIGGTQVETNLDIYAAAGGANKALIRSYGTTVSGGVLTLRFVTVNANATIHAIEVTAGNLCSPTVSPTRTPVVSSTPTPTASASATRSPTFTISPTATPSATPYPTPDACSLALRVNAGGTAFTGAGGLVWAADKAYSAGSYGYVSYAAGTAGTSAGPIAGTTDDALFTAERWGNPVRYRFDLPNGPYQVRVRLAESYFSSAGQRSVTIVANGVTVLNNSDLFTWAGGLFVAKDLSFISTVSNGHLDLTSSSSNNNGTFMAIEVLGLTGCSPTVTRTFTPGQPSATRTSSSTRTGSPTPSSTATASQTRTVTATQTSSATATPSPTPSHTVTVTATSSPVASATPTGTISPSRTATPSLTVTVIGSLTDSPTRSNTTTATRSATVSATATATASPSATRSATPSVSPSLTTTGSPSASPTAVPTGSSATPTRSPVQSATASPTHTLTPTPSRTVSPTPSLSPSATLSASPTATATPSPSDTASASPSVTLSSTASPMLTATLTPSPVMTASASPTLTLSPSATVTVVPSSATPTATPSVTGAVATATLTATPSSAVTAAGTPSNDGPLVIDEHRIWPQPMGLRGGYLSVKLQGRADRLSVCLYSVAMRRVAQVEAPGFGPGWGRLTLGPALWQGLAPGLYFYTVEASLGSVHSAPVSPGRILLIR